MATEASIPSYLLEAPQGPPLAPPIDTAVQLLPFALLRWENFERLCLSLAREEGSPEHVQLFGTRGQAQAGIDIYSRLSDGAYAVYQCKQYPALTAADIQAAVAEFLQGEWADKAVRYVLCTSGGVARTQLARQIEYAADCFAERPNPIAFGVWDSETLSAVLKDRPEIVQDFFGTAWLERFCPGQAARSQGTYKRDGKRRTPALEDYVDWSSRNYLDSPRTFIGRKWMFARLDSFSKRHASGYVRVVAEAGLGKTALAAAIATHYQAPAFFFSEGAGRTRADQCLNHLCVELISRYNLAQDRLPDRAGEDAGYLSRLLHEAVEENDAVWLVIDALDEAQPAAAAATMPLPEQLPPGVFVVITHRPGDYGPAILPARGTAQEVVRIIADSKDQTHDVIAYLHHRAEHDVAVQAALARHQPPVTCDYFAERLAIASEGNFMYLDYMLDDFIDAEMPSLSLDELPHGLAGYYGRMWRVMAQQADCGERWEGLYLPVIGRLAVAAEPVSVAWLASQISQSPGEIKRALRVWERFLSHGGEPTGWRIVHQSFRDFLGETDEISLGESHQVVAAYYLDRDHWRSHDRYASRHLAAHLRLAGSDEQLFELIDTSDWRTDQLTDDPGGATHLSDIAHAWALARDINERAIGRGDLPPLLLREVTCAIATTELRSIAGYFPPELLARLVTTGTWTAQQALAAIQLIHSPYDRAQAFVELVPHLSGSQRVQALSEGLTAVSTVEPHLRAAVLAQFVPHLPASMLTDALTLAYAILAPEARIQAFAALAPHLPDSARLEVLADVRITATAIAEPQYRARALVSFALCLPEDERTEMLMDAVSVALAVDRSLDRIRVLVELVPHLSMEERVRVLTEVVSDTAIVSDPWALVLLAPCLSEGERASIMVNAVAAAIALNDPRERAQVLVDIASYLPTEERVRVSREVVSHAIALDEPRERAHLLIECARGLPENERGRALMNAASAAGALNDPLERVRVLIKIAHGLPASERKRVLADAVSNAAAVDDPRNRAEAHIEIVPYLPKREQAQVLKDASAAAMDIADSDSWCLVLSELAPHLPDDQRIGLLTDALALAITIPHLQRRVRALTRFAPLLPDAPRIKALIATLTAITTASGSIDRAHLLIQLVPQLPDGLITEALAVVTAITDPWARAGALAALVPRLPDDLLAEAAATTTDGRALALIAIAPDLPDSLLIDAIAAATTIGDPCARALALAELAPNLSGAQRIQALSDAFAAATMIADADSQVMVLTKLAPDLSGAQQIQALSDALTAIATFTDPFQYAVALVELVPHMPDEQRAKVLSNAVTVAGTLIDPFDRAVVLNTLIHHVTHAQREQVLTDALAAAAAITFNPFVRAHMLAELVSHMSSDLRSDVFATVTDIADPLERATMLTALVPHMSDGQRVRILPDALGAAARIADPFGRAAVLTNLAPHLSGDRRKKALSDALAAAPAIANPRAQAEVLTEIASHRSDPPEELLPDVFAAVLTIADPFDRAIALARLVPHMSDARRSQTLADALASIAKIGDPTAETWALKALVPHMSEEERTRTLIDALTAASAIAEPKRRAEILAALARELPLASQYPYFSEALRVAAAAGEMVVVDVVSEFSPMVHAAQGANGDGPMIP
jgi:small neutral amino acid transporter SnatA (MarC family)